MLELQAFFTSPIGYAVYLTLVAAFADFAVGMWAAWKSGSLDWSEAAAFLRTHVVGRVLPIFGLLIFGWLANAPGLTAAGLAGEAVYLGETLASIQDSWQAAATKSQPVPTE